MRRYRLLVLLLLAAASPAAGQDRLVRGDISGTLGWFNANKRELDPYQDWYNRSLIAEGGAGWYWSDHWKTELIAGGTTEATVYGSATIVHNGQPLFAPSRIAFSTRRLSLMLHYQFGDNAWFHPYLGAGVDAVWERSERRDEPIYAYDPAIRQSRLVRSASTFPRDTDARARPAAAAGFKAYLNRRTFFRGDLRATFASRLDEVVLRCGFGVDF